MTNTLTNTSPRPRPTGAWVRGSQHGAQWEYTANPERWYGEFWKLPPQMAAKKEPT